MGENTLARKFYCIWLAHRCNRCNLILHTTRLPLYARQGDKALGNIPKRDCHMEEGEVGSNPSNSIAKLGIHCTSKLSRLDGIRVHTHNKPQVVTQIASASSCNSSSSSLGCKEGHHISTENNFAPQNSSKNEGKGGPHGTKFLGVRQRPSGRWVAEIKDASQKLRLWLGTFDRAEDAARAYDDAARFLRGKNTRTNFAAQGNSIHMQPNSSKASRLLLLRHALAKAAQNTATTQGKYHATADVCIAKSHLDQHPKANPDNNNNNKKKKKKNVVIGGDSDGEGGAMPATTRGDHHWVLSSSSAKSTPYSHVGINSLISNAGMQCSLSQAAAPGSGQSNAPNIGTKSINQTAVCYPHLANVASFDRFCTSGWNIQQSLITLGKQHASGSEYIYQSHHGKTAATIRVAPSFNASLYSEAEKFLCRHGAAARSSEPPIIANGS